MVQMTTPSPFGLNRKAHMGVKQTPKSQDSEESNDDEYFDDAGLVDGDYQYGGNDDYQYDDEDMLMYRDEFGVCAIKGRISRVPCIRIVSLYLMLCVFVFV